MKRFLLLLIGIFIWYQLTRKPETMKPYHANIEKLTLENPYYRRVLYTTPTLQLVLMTLLPGEEIGVEQHNNVSQFFRIEQGNGVAIIDGIEYPLSDGDVVIVPPGAKHNFINTSSVSLKLYSLYSPPEHPPDRVQCEKPS